MKLKQLPSSTADEMSITLAEVNKLHEEILSAAHRSLEQGIRVGELLTQFKKQCGHGKWGAFIEKWLPFSERTAQNYLNLYANLELLKSANFADLTLSDAYELIRDRKSSSESTTSDHSDQPSEDSGQPVVAEKHSNMCEPRASRKVVMTSAGGDVSAQQPVMEPDVRAEKQRIIQEINLSITRVLRKLTVGPMGGLASFQKGFGEFLASWEAEKNGVYN